MSFGGRRLSAVSCCCCLLLLGFGVSGIDQGTINYMATYMDIRHDVLDNLRDGLKTYEAQLTFTNNGSREIRGGKWVMYICYVRMIEPDHLPDPDGYVLKEFGVKFTHVQGCIFTLIPTADFGSIRPYGSKKVRFLGENWSVSKTDIMPNWYVTAEGLEPRTFDCTAGESLSFVGPFNKREKWKRYDFKNEEEEAHDRYDPYTPRTRYAINSIRNLGGPGKRVIPTPLEISINDEETVDLFTRDWVIVAPPELSNEATFLSAQMNIGLSHTAPNYRLIKLATGRILVKLNGTVQMKPEAYSIVVDSSSETVRIMGQDAAGVWYGVQTLLGLVQENGRLPKVVITDAPRFGYRGVEFDTARNFHGKNAVFKLLDLMTVYKLNKLHLHLTDDEGWRLEIPGLEELTTIGAHRCHDLDEQQCIMPQLGSGPTTSSSGSGYFSASDYKEILQYAKVRHIEVIPEIDMPGHSRAAIKAMEARRNRLTKAGDLHGAKQYLLSDPDDPSSYKSIQMYTDNAINPCMQSSYDFFKKVLETIVDYHRDVSPLQTYHFGGDEVAKGAWENSTACAALMKASWEVLDKRVLKEYFVRHISNLTAHYGLNLAAWEDGVMKSGDEPYDRSALKNREVYAYPWDNVWEWGQASRAYKLANAGFKIVMSQATHLYFDHPYEPDPNERGYYWAPRFTDTYKTFGFMPENLYANADVARSGDPIKQSDLCGIDGKKCVPLEKPENLAGIQGHIWSETIRTQEHFDYMVFPRLLALAERAWHRADWESEANNVTRQQKELKDWEQFANTLGHQDLRRLDRMGVKYRIPPPGAIVSDSRLQVNVAYPGLVVQYSVNGGSSWMDWTNSETLENSGRIFLRTRSGDNSRTSRVVVLNWSGSGAKSPWTRTCLTVIACMGLFGVIL